MLKRLATSLLFCTVALLVLIILAQRPQVNAATTTSTATPTQSATLSCEDIVTHALLVLQNTCDKLDRNSACYGNNTIVSDLADTAQSFQQPGDKVPLKIVRRLATSPLDTTSGTWGLSLIKAQANLPDTLPGQNITFLIYGDTRLQNPDGKMQAFYFSTGLGASTCAAAPKEALLIRSPDHTKVTFTANGVIVSIASTVMLQAIPNQQMSVHLIEGHATVSTAKGSQTLLPGQAVTIALGGTNGLVPQSAPSKPVQVGMDTASLSMLASLNSVTGTQPILPIQGCVTAVGDHSLTIGGYSIKVDGSNTALSQLKVGDCVTLNGTVQTEGGVPVIVTDGTVTPATATSTPTSTPLGITQLPNATTVKANSAGSTATDSSFVATAVPPVSAAPTKASNPGNGNSQGNNPPGNNQGGNGKGKGKSISQNDN
jgi:hypothetical protein